MTPQPGMGARELWFVGDNCKQHKCFECAECEQHLFRADAFAAEQRRGLEQENANKTIDACIAEVNRMKANIPEGYKTAPTAYTLRCVAEALAALRKE